MRAKARDADLVGRTFKDAADHKARCPRMSHAVCHYCGFPLCGTDDETFRLHSTGACGGAVTEAD